MKQKTVLVLMSYGFTPQFEGVIRYAREHFWRLVPINCHVENAELLHADTRNPLRLDDLRAAWSPSGIIVDYTAAPIVYRAWKTSDIPLVFPDRHSSDLGPTAACVTSDAQSIAQAVSRELFSLAYANYAFVPSPDKSSWNKEREEAFRCIVQNAGCTYQAFRETASGETGPTRAAALRRWLRHLPKPCCIFAANDHTADEIRSICRTLDLTIPEDIALVGVDNQPDICEAGEPTITSIQQNLEDCYYQSARLLDELIEDPRHAPRSANFGVLRIVRRASTRPLRIIDARVHKALEFIRLHAAERITPKDVVAAMGCHRSYADQRFRGCTGHTIIEEISLRRIELVKDELRRPGTLLTDLPQTCGFASDVDMRRVFKKLTGLSPRDWRKQQP